MKEEYTTDNRDYIPKVHDRYAIHVETPFNRAIEGVLVILNKNKTSRHHQQAADAKSNSHTSVEEFEKDLEEILQEKLINKHVRFRCRFSDDLTKFEELPGGTHARDHIRRVKIHAEEKDDDEKNLDPEEEEEEEEQLLRKCLSKYQNVPLPLDKPLWEVILIEDYSKGFALFWRIHHALGDGYSVGNVFYGICDNQRALIREQRQKISSMIHTGTKMHMLIQRLLSWRIVVWLLTLAFGIWIYLGTIRVSFRWLWSAIMRQPKTPITDKKKLTNDKYLAWLKPGEEISVRECGRLGDVFGATINDVMVSCLAGAINRYIARKERDYLAAGGSTDSKEYKEQFRRDIAFRIAIPVDLRPSFAATQQQQQQQQEIHHVAEDEDEDAEEEEEEVEEEEDTVESTRAAMAELGNIFGFITPTLPLMPHSSSVERLQRISKILLSCKRSSERYVGYYAVYVLALLPVRVVVGIFNFLCSGVAFIATNVRGTTQAVSIGGHRVDRIIGISPAPANSTMAALFMSYRGKLNMSVNAAFSDPELLAEEFMNEYKQLRTEINEYLAKQNQQQQQQKDMQQLQHAKMA